MRVDPASVLTVDWVALDRSSYRSRLASWREDEAEWPEHLREGDPARTAPTWATFVLSRASGPFSSLITVRDSRVLHFEHAHQSFAEEGGALLLAMACAPATETSLPATWRTWHRGKDEQWHQPPFDGGAVYQATLQVAAPFDVRGVVLPTVGASEDERYAAARQTLSEVVGQLDALATRVLALLAAPDASSAAKVDR